MLHNFSYLIPGRLAGSNLPGGSRGELERDLEDLKAWGIGAIVSLTSQPLDASALARAGLKSLHIPIPDFCPPSIRQIDTFVEFIHQNSGEGKGAVLVHCHAGVGRTGTMLAAYLVTEGYSAEDAIGEVRRARPGSIETREQEEAIADWEKYFARTGRRA